MVTSVNPYPPVNKLSNVGNAAMDFLSLDLVIQVNNKLQESTRDFLSSYDPHKLYLNIQNINNKQPESFISTYA